MEFVLITKIETFHHFDRDRRFGIMGIYLSVPSTDIAMEEGSGSAVKYAVGEMQVCGEMRIKIAVNSDHFVHVTGCLDFSLLTFNI